MVPLYHPCQGDGNKSSSMEGRLLLGATLARYKYLCNPADNQMAVSLVPTLQVKRHREVE